MADGIDVKHQEQGTQGVFFVERGGARIAEMTYSVPPGRRFIIIDHTRVDDVLRGQGVGAKLVNAAVAMARRDGIGILPLCPFAKATFDRTPELTDVVWKG